MDRILEIALGLTFTLVFHFERAEENPLIIALTLFVAAGLSLGISGALRLLGSHLTEKFQGNTAQEDLNRSYRLPFCLVLLSSALSLPLAAFRFWSGDVKIQRLPRGGEATSFFYNEQLLFAVRFDLPLVLRVLQISLVATSMAILVFALVDRQRLEMRSALIVAASVYATGAIAFFFAFPLLFTFFNPS
jgi:hypothetical protein